MLKPRSSGTRWSSRSTSHSWAISIQMTASAAWNSVDLAASTRVRLNITRNDINTTRLRWRSHPSNAMKPLPAIPPAAGGNNLTVFAIIYSAAARQPPRLSLLRQLLFAWPRYHHSSASGSNCASVSFRRIISATVPLQAEEAALPAPSASRNIYKSDRQKGTTMIQMWPLSSWESTSTGLLRNMYSWTIFALNVNHQSKQSPKLPKGTRTELAACARTRFLASTVWFSLQTIRSRINAKRLEVWDTGVTVTSPVIMVEVTFTTHITTTQA